MGFAKRNEAFKVKNTKINRAIDKSGREVDVAIKKFMVDRRNSTLKGLERKRQTIFG